MKTKRMSRAEAEAVVGKANARKNILANMALALSFHPWSNTPAEWMRLEAVVVLLGGSAPTYARKAVKAWKLRTLIHSRAA